MTNRRKAFNRWVRWKSKFLPELKRVLLKPRESSVNLYTGYAISRFSESEIEKLVPEALREEARTRAKAAHAAIREFYTTRLGAAAIYAQYNPEGKAALVAELQPKVTAVEQATPP